jgi:D-3-phosphoglycerate dehydrogenase
LINEVVLIKTLKSKLIAGAALDVFEDEPPKPNNPLFALSNVILTPHSAALSKEALDRMSYYAAMGIHEVLSGKKPTWPVNSSIQKFDSTVETT